LSSDPLPAPDATSLDALQQHFLAILPRIQTHAQIQFRFLKCPGKRADAIAEVIALAWKWFLRLVEQGKDIDEFVSVLADFAVRHVRAGRRLCGQQKSKDALSPVAYRRGIRVEALPCCTRRCRADLYSDPHGQDHLDAFEERLRDNTRSPVPDQAAFRIDYPAWLLRLGQRQREIAQDLAQDHSTGELAHRHKLSPGRISQMRRELHLDWQRFHGETL
jgi:hypothetical protein